MHANTRLKPARQANKSPDLEIIYRPLSKLRLDPTDPWLRNKKKQIRQIKESVRVFGFLIPILVDRHGRVIAGHGRLLAARELGMSEIPTICIDHLTPAQLRAFTLVEPIFQNTLYFGVQHR